MSRKHSHVVLASSDDLLIAEVSAELAQSVQAHFAIDWARTCPHAYAALEAGSIDLCVIGQLADDYGAMSALARTALERGIPVVAILDPSVAPELLDTLRMLDIDVVCRGDSFPGQIEQAVLRAMERADLRSGLREKEHELACLRSQLAILFDRSLHGVCRLGSDWSIESANKSFCTMLHADAPPNSPPPPGLFRSMFGTDGQFAPMGRAMVRRMASCGHDEREGELRRSDGSVLNCHVTTAPVDPNDPNAGYLATVVDITPWKRFEQLFRQQLGQISSLHSIGQAIAAGVDLKTMLGVILKETMEHAGADASAVYLYHHVSRDLELAATAGFRRAVTSVPRVCLGTGLAGRVAAEKRRIRIGELETCPDSQAPPKQLLLDGFTTCEAVPLISRGQIHGVLEIYYARPRATDGEWTHSVSAIAELSAVAIESVTTHQSSEQLRLEMTVACDGTLESWSQALELRGIEGRGHSERVAWITTEIGLRLGLSQAQLENMRRGALIHDIGQMAVPDEILFKNSSLTEEEWQVVRQHPVHAYRLLGRIHYLRTALDIPYCHHERWNGSGYPRKLREEQIPLAARIFAVADTYDSLQLQKPYRPAMAKADAHNYVRGRAGIDFDPAVIEAFDHAAL